MHQQDQLILLLVIIPMDYNIDYGVVLFGVEQLTIASFKIWEELAYQILIFPFQETYITVVGETFK